MEFNLAKDTDSDGWSLNQPVAAARAPWQGRWLGVARPPAEGHGIGAQRRALKRKATLVFCRNRVCARACVVFQGVRRTFREGDSLGIDFSLRPGTSGLSSGAGCALSQSQAGESRARRAGRAVSPPLARGSRPPDGRRGAPLPGCVLAQPRPPSPPETHAIVWRKADVGRRACPRNCKRF